MESYFEKHSQLWLILLVAGTFLLVNLAPVSYAGSDARGTLLTSQSILKFGTIRLDAYSEILNTYHYKQINGHIYYRYPLGTPLLALPVVWLANLRGADMALTDHDQAIQRVLSAISLAAISLLIFLIARCYVGYAASFLLSAAFTLGTALISTLGTALWNMDFETVLILLSIYLALRSQLRSDAMPNPYVLGVLLFGAYLCRPTAAIPVALIVFYIFLQHRMTAVRIAATFAVLFVGFVLFSFSEYGQPLPEYYRGIVPNAIVGVAYSAGLVCNLISPSRGLFVFSPFLILVAVGALILIRKLRQSVLFWLMIIWVAVHLFVVSGNSAWWGGWAFGARMFADATPALLLLTLLVWHEANLSLAPALRRPALWLFIALVAAAVLINSYQGLYNTYTLNWNAKPNVDQHPEVVFDWRFPQFLTSPQMLEARDQEYP